MKKITHLLLALAVSAGLCLPVFAQEDVGGYVDKNGGAQPADEAAAPKEEAPVKPAPKKPAPKKKPKKKKKVPPPSEYKFDAVEKVETYKFDKRANPIVKEKKKKPAKKQPAKKGEEAKDENGSEKAKDPKSLDEKSVKFDKEKGDE